MVPSTLFGMIPKIWERLVSFSTNNEIEDLKTKLAARDRIDAIRRFSEPDVRGWFVLQKPQFGYRPGKYCSCCFEKENKMFLLVQVDGQFGRQSWECKGCKNVYTEHE